MVTELEQLYVPQDERGLRRIQRRVDDIDRRSRAWGKAVVDLLPKGLLMLDEEYEMLGLFLAQQRRLNEEIDAQTKPESTLSRLIRGLPIPMYAHDNQEILREAHRTVCARLESEIDRAFQSFCDVRGIASTEEPAIDWRVSVRYLAQEVHRLASRIDIRREYYTSPERFEIALRTRDLAADIVTHREIMLDSVVFQSMTADSTPVEETLLR
jgi:hypothetical protein